MWWGEELKPLYSLRPDANPRRDRNSIADGKQTPVRKLIPYCQAHKPPPYQLPHAGEGREGADVELQTRSARRRGGGCRARVCCCDKLCGLEDPLAQRGLERDPIWHHDPGSGDRRQPYFHVLLGHEIFDGRTFGHITGQGDKLHRADPYRPFVALLRLDFLHAFETQLQIETHAPVEYREGAPARLGRNQISAA